MQAGERGEVDGKIVQRVAAAAVQHEPLWPRGEAEEQAAVRGGAGRYGRGQREPATGEFRLDVVPAADVAVDGAGHIGGEQCESGIEADGPTSHAGNQSRRARYAHGQITGAKLDKHRLGGAIQFVTTREALFFQEPGFIAGGRWNHCGNP